MDPITLALLGSTGLSAIGSLVGAKNSSEAAEQNNRTSMLNYQQRERERAEAMAMARELLARNTAETDRTRADTERYRAEARADAERFRSDAERQRAESQLGVTDPTGRSYFDPQRGWVTELSPESLNQLARSRAAGGAADNALRDLNNFQPITGERMSGLLYDKALRGLNDAFQGQLATGLRTATRQSNPRLAAELLAQSSRKQGEAQHDAAIDSEIKGREYASNYNTGQRNALTNIYGALTGQSRNIPTGPTNIVSTFAKEANNFDNLLPSVYNTISGIRNPNPNQERGILTAAMQQGGTQAPTQPDNAIASSLASVGQLGYGAAKDYTASENLKNYIAALGSKYPGSALTLPTRNTGVY